MTTVQAAAGGGRYRFRMQGHATGSVEGCAFLSGITYALLAYLADESRVEAEDCRVEPGDVELRFRGGQEAETAYRMAMAGARLLERDHPELVRVEEKNLKMEA